MRFRKVWLTYKHHWLTTCCIFIIVSSTIIFTSLVRNKIYIAEGRIQFDPVNQTSSITISKQKIDHLELSIAHSKILSREIAIIRSNLIAKETIRKANLIDQTGNFLNVNLFLKNLNIEQFEEEKTLRIQYKDKDAQKAAYAVNTLIKVYLRNNIHIYSSEFKPTRKIIESQLLEAEASVKQAEINLRNFKEEHDITSIQFEASSTMNIVSDLQKQIIDIQAQIQNTEKQSEVLKDNLGDLDTNQAVHITASKHSSSVRAMMRQIHQLETDLMIQRSRFQESSPQIILLRSKLNNLKNLLNTRIEPIQNGNFSLGEEESQLGLLQRDLGEEVIKLEGKKAGLINQEKTLSRTYNNYIQRAQLLPQLEEEKQKLEQRLAVSQSTYSLLLNRLQNIQIIENQNLGNTQVVTLADVPNKPAPLDSLTYLVAGFMGLLTASLTVYLFALKEQSIQSINEVKELLNLTLLGLIPSSEKPSSKLHTNPEQYFLLPKVIVQEEPRSLVSAAYHLLQANLNFLSSIQNQKVIVITSSIPREGKSTISANLAMALAQVGQKVLLIDGDMHYPMQHQIWNISNQLGFSHLLVEPTSFNLVISSVGTNLDVLPAGMRPPHPKILLESHRMIALIDQFSTIYDYVIIDAPALNEATDALTLGKIADGIILVVRPEWVRYENLVFAKKLLAPLGQKVLGQIVNGLAPHKKLYKSYSFVNRNKSLSHTFF